MEGGGGVDFYEISIRNASSGKSFRLIPRWESSAPQPEAAREFLTLGEPAASPPASEDTELRLAPSLTEMVFSSMMKPREVCSIPLVPCSSFDSDCLQAVQGNWYVELAIYPDDGRATLRMYETKPDKMIWMSTGFYFLGQISTASDIEDEVASNKYPAQISTASDIEDEVASDKYPAQISTASDIEVASGKYPAQVLGNKPVCYHGKATADVLLPPLKVDFERDFIVEGRIGQGTEGIVSQCSSISGSFSSAVKKIDLGNLMITSAASEPREVSIFAKLSHDNIAVPYLAWHEDGTSRFTSTVGCAFISMELCDRSLEQYLNEREEVDLESNAHIFKQILEVLKFMHGNGVMHRDIKPANILLESDLTVKLIDFGIAKGTAEPAVGTYASLPYCAPELGSSCTSHNERVDIFAAGIVYCELFLPCRKKHRQGRSLWSQARAQQSHKKLMLLAKKIREQALKLDVELLGRPFNLDDAVHGTDILNDWRGDMSMLKGMISPRPNERQSAVELLDLFDKKVPDGVMEVEL